ncbi:uncharacterized protein LOC129726926 isoform X2 [Wyeomyia smithii]|uniref:uncharacterized protein LOC129726926 isoform X2 n=1 Tax=Wyeomyia smithii TaxID=174621 RepID=UPI002467E02C|nr:uncharacterized protein LOC129726926 isoform X2 [Wyeomyia smithii]
MAKTNLTVVEAREQFPIYTQNQYNLLENYEEHPTLTETYADKVKSNIKAIPPKLRSQNTKRGSEDNNRGNMTQTHTDKKRKTTQEAATNGVALSNRYKVDEKEKQAWKRDMKASKVIENRTVSGRMEYVEEHQDTSDDEDQDLEYQDNRKSILSTSLRLPEEGIYEEQDTEMEVLKYGIGSRHLIVKIEIQAETTVKKWFVNRQRIEEQMKTLESENISTVRDLQREMKQIIQSARQKSKYEPKFWWNEEIEEAWKEKKN